MKPTSERRHFAATVTAVAVLVASPLTALAQPAAKVYRIGVLGGENTSPWNGLRQGLREHGYVEGRNVAIEWRWSEGFAERFPALATELVNLRVDVIVAAGTQAIQAAKQATSAIPIVMGTGSYPDKLGFVESLARPGGNVTGLSNLAPELMAKKLDLLKEFVPKVSRVAVIFNPASPVEPLGLRELQTAAQAAQLEIVPVEVRNPDDFPAAFTALSALRPDALLAFGNPVNFKGRQLIADFALRHRLPSIYEGTLFVEAGGLISYAPSFFEMFRRSATYVDKILKGTKPADLPVELPTKFELVINHRTAQALDLAIPPGLRLRADQIID